MNYPFWDVPHLGSGWVIGLIAIFHVMISHFAVGGGFYLVLAETKARREKRADWLQVLQKHSKFFLILTGVFGAVTGVGIWFAIGLAHPEATSALIHNFVFGWAVEWVFFMVELTTAAVYYYTWDRIPDSLHIKVGWVYAIASFLTLFIINGILTFMLTPGDPWLAVAGTGQESSRFVQAFFNPLFWPSLFLRILACASLAGVWALVTCARLDSEKYPEMKTALLRWSSRWVIPSFALLPICFAWYLWNVPEAQRVLMQLGISNIGAGGFSQLTRTILIIPLSSASVVGVVYLFIWRSPVEVRMRHAASVVLLALFATASTEYGREMLRKPYVIGQYMFSNGVRAKTVSALNTNGYLGASLWTPALPATATPAEQQLAKGEAMFRGQCAACHTRDVYRSMRRLVGERNREGIASVLKMLHDYDKDSPYRKYMPPLVGRPDEIAALGDYLASLTAKPEKTAPASAPLAKR
jgi:cytochrome bd ubiquinol oxidase subunit I